jgi:NAD(P)H-hydrate epimerase
MKLVSIEEMQMIEKEADAKGLSYDEMMAKAGYGLAEVVMETYTELEEKRVLGLVGSGNNGGDTLVALTHLAKNNWSATAIFLKGNQNQNLIRTFINAGGKIETFDESHEKEQINNLLKENLLILDGVLGTGFHLPLRGSIKRSLSFIKEILVKTEANHHIVAVDCPSGVDCNTGEVAEECIPAKLTVTMAAIKQGLLKFPAFEFVGELQVVDIGLSKIESKMTHWQNITTFVPDTDWVFQNLPPRPLNSHKGTFGTSLIIAGSINYTGAALLAAEAAYRIGSGLVTVAIPKIIHSAVAGRLTEATWLPLPHKDGFIAETGARIIFEHLNKVTSILIGPGFGLSQTSGHFITKVINHIHKVKAETTPPPLVIDADGLKLLAQIPNWSNFLGSTTILTPHPGEMAVISGLSTQEIQSDRLNIAKKFSQKWNLILVLKGAFTIIASPDGKTAVIPVATPALASAGTGDVLAGIITGLLAQKVSPFKAAVIGAWIHGQAGLLAAETLGNTASVIASDVLASIIDVLTLFSPVNDSLLIEHHRH